VAASTYYHTEMIIASVGTTAHWFKVGLASSTAAATSQRRYTAIEILINSTSSTGWVRRDGTAAQSTGVSGNFIIPKGRTGGPNRVLIPYSTKISIKASAQATAHVRGVTRALLD